MIISNSKRCSQCNTEVDTADAFCPNCGARTSTSEMRVCIRCRATNSTSDQFCSECGAELQPTPAPTPSITQSSPAQSAPSRAISSPPAQSAAKPVYQVLHCTQCHATLIPGDTSCQKCHTRFDSPVPKIRADSPPVTRGNITLPPTSPQVKPIPPVPSSAPAPPPARTVIALLPIHDSRQVPIASGSFSEGQASSQRTKNILGIAGVAVVLMLVFIGIISHLNSPQASSVSVAPPVPSAATYALTAPPAPSMPTPSTQAPMVLDASKQLVDCLNCHGTGKCDMCGGTGQCIACMGTGKETDGSICTICGGSGKCPLCHGSEHCIFCEGTGKMTQVEAHNFTTIRDQSDQYMQQHPVVNYGASMHN